MKILIAEDNPVTVHVLQKTLKYWNHEVRAVNDGSQALLVIESWGKPDIIISDWIMPRLTGVELCRKIRSDPDIQDIYIILLTAKGKIDDMIEGFNAGVDDFITKPVSEGDLNASLKKGGRCLNGEMGHIDREELRRKNIEEFKKRHQISQ